MRWLEGAGEKLGAKEGQVGVYGEDLGFRVKMANRGHLHIPRSYSKGSVLNNLKSI